MNSFYKRYFMLMIPMALKELVAALVNLVDNVMVGQLGETSIAAVGIANQFFFLFSVFTFGICGGAGVFASQYWGIKDTKSMKSVLGLNLILVSVLSVLFVSMVYFFPGHLMGIFTSDTEVVNEGVKYLSIVCFSYTFSALTAAYDISLCCSENVRIPFICRVLGLIINIALNQVLIFGELGFPTLGVAGAAIATVIARAMEFTTMILVIYSKKLIQAAKFRELFSIPKRFIFKYLKSASPIVVNEIAWSIGITVYSWVFAKIGTEAVVMTTITSNLERLLLVFFFGGGNAAGIIVGKAIGRGKEKAAYIYAKKIAYLTVGLSLFIAVVFVFSRPLILGLYNISDEVYSMTNNAMILMAIAMNFKAISYLMIVGVFRNGGNTHLAMFIDLGSVWLIGVPVTILAGIVFHLPVIYTFAFMYLEELIKLIVCIPWFRSKRWIIRLTQGTGA